MTLSFVTVEQPERASSFVAECRGAGFSPAETVFLAEQHTMFDRGILRPNKKGPLMLMDFFQGCARRVSEQLNLVKTPSDLCAYRKNWLNIWIGNDTYEREQVFKLLAFAFKPTLISRIHIWADPDASLNSAAEWSDATQKVGHTLRRTELVGGEETESTPLKQALKETGLHTLTWNRWLYPTKEDQARLGKFLVSFNKGLQAQTGLSGGVLGLGGSVRLHLDDDTIVESGGVFSNSLKTSNKRKGQNAFGTTQIQVPSYLGFIALAHEWFHAFDCTVGDIHECKMSSEIKDTEASVAVLRLNEERENNSDDATIYLREALRSMREDRSFSQNGDDLFLEFDQLVSQGGPEQGWAFWAQNQDSAIHLPDATRSLAVIGSYLTGDTKKSVAQTWLRLYPDTYQELPQEQMAYAFERACLYTGHLPSSSTQPLWAARNCLPSDQKHAHDVMRDFFASPDIQETWKALMSPPDKSPLLDHVAARIFAKRASQKYEGPSSKSYTL